MKSKKKTPIKPEKVKWPGGCGRTFFNLLNKEFGHPMKNEEVAADLLCGGIMMQGHQCGMLWGSALAAGAESFRRNKDKDKAIGLSILTTRKIVESFSSRTKTVNCRDISQCDFTSKFELAKYMVKFILFIDRSCFKLADNWAPEVIKAVKEELSNEKAAVPHPCVSCASIVVEKMGGSDEEQVIVAGFAGGMGLSGNGCGALSAAIWLKTLDWCRKHPGKNPSMFNNTDGKKLLDAFNKETGSELLCRNICGKSFNSLEEHSNYINEGGCEKLLNVLAQE